MVDLAKGFKRPFSDLKKLLIGTIIMFIPIVNIMGYGYGLKCAESVLKKRGNYKLPKWENWGDLFVKGLIGIVIAFIYLIPLAIMAVFLFGAAALAGITLFTTGVEFTDILLGVGMVYMAILFVIALIVILMIPLALMNYVKKWKFGDAFDFKTIKKKITGRYIGIWFLSIIYAGILAGVLSYIPLIGPAAATFISLVTTYTWYAEAYKGK